MLLEDMLEQLEHRLVRICTSNAAALAAIEEEAIDAVLLDLNLQGERSDPVAARLREKNIPFVVASGGVEGAQALGAAAILAKPYRLDEIEQALAACRVAVD